MKILLSILFTIAISAQALSADALLLQYCTSSVGLTIEYGKIKREVKDLHFDSVVLKDSKISNVASMYAGKGVGLTVILYIYDGAVPSVSLEMKDASYIDLLEEACNQIGYVFWIENFTIHIMPETKLAEHKNPKQRVIRSVIRK